MEDRKEDSEQMKGNEPLELFELGVARLHLLEPEGALGGEGSNVLGELLDLPRRVRGRVLLLVGQLGRGRGAASEEGGEAVLALLLLHDLEAILGGRGLATAVASLDLGRALVVNVVAGEERLGRRSAQAVGREEERANRLVGELDVVHVDVVGLGRLDEFLRR